MELQEIIKIIKKYKNSLILSVLIGLAAGAGYFLSPKTYYATGSLYVKRSTDTLKFKYFAYEGYYAQQTGLAYTNTVITLLQSPDIRFETLNKLNLPTDTFSLRRYSKLITARKAGPQLILLTVKSNSPDEAKKIWEALTDNAIDKNKQINTNGDQLLSISKISENPIIRESYKPLWLCMLCGGLIVPSLLIFLFTLRGYSKWK